MTFKALVSATALTAALGFSSSAMATITFTSGTNCPQCTENNVLFTDDANLDDNVVRGRLNAQQTDSLQFTAGAGENLNINPGQSFLSAEDGNLNQLEITAIDPFIGFEAIQFAVNGDIGSTFVFTGTSNTGTQTFNYTITQNGEGPNTLLFTTDAVQFITSLSFVANGNNVSLTLDDVRQVRVGAFVVPGPIAGAGLPALMALGGFVWARRRKAAGAAVPA